MASANDTTGLGLFDETATAVGNFPSALRGYDRSAVDDYVRSLEAAVIKGRRHASSLEEQVAEVNKQLSQALEKQQAAEVDFTNLGERAREILRLAEEQARDVGNQASADADRMRELARREADQVRREAQQLSAEIRSRGVAEIEQLRVRGQEDIRSQVDKTNAEAEAIIAAARRQAESLQRAADHEAQTLRQTAYLDTENLRRSVELEVAEMRREVAEERDLAVNHLRSVQEEAAAKTGAVLAEATEHSRQAAERLEVDIAEGARIRAEALAEAERVKVAASAEAEELVVAARKQAAAIAERTHQEFHWRKQQLRREMDQLGQRKQAVLSQLASLSALAEQTASSFPDLDDLDEFDAEEGDRTITMPPQPPALPPSDGEQRAPHASTNGDQHDESVQGEAHLKTRELPAVGRAPSHQGDSDDDPDGEINEDSIDIDGDATIMVPASQLPAGTAHLRNGAGPATG
ncbi:MAG TPA: DivIVA domain-containing protein [Propionibacteriaceae bacterium]|nr:DivIVA domain-containing protein [Propionibacteriaceae bacterium]